MNSRTQKNKKKQEAFHFCRGVTQVEGDLLCTVAEFDLEFPDNSHIFIQITFFEWNVNLHWMHEIRPTKAQNGSFEDVVFTYLLLGFGGVALDRLPGHQRFKSFLNCADLLRLDVKLQGKERLQGGRLFRVLLIHHRSVKKCQTTYYR